MATPSKEAKKGKKKPVPVKTSLNNPYDMKWAPLEKGNTRYILKKLKDKLDSLGLQKKRVNVYREWGNRRKSKARGSRLPEEHATRCEPGQGGWSEPGARRQLAIGINEVTKGLERNELSLVLVCCSVRPPHMTNHLIPLSQSRSVPACQLQDLSATLSASFGLGSVLALGFRRGGDAFAELLEDITPKVPPLHVAWLSAERRSGEPQNEPREAAPSDGAAQQPEEPETPRKRKREEAEKPVLTLQPLKVKKIIPNPSKIRKPKGKKKAT